MVTSVPYERTGRVEQKGRTRAAMVEAARALLAEGVTPTVEQAADRAGISRTTSYRYFRNQPELLQAAYPDYDAESLLPPDAPADPAARLDIVIDKITRQIIEHETALRANLRMSLEGSSTLPLRQGRAIRWIEEALAPLGLPRPAMHRLALAIRAATGIEAFVWLTDIGGLSRPDAAALVRSSAQALLAASAGTAPARRAASRGARVRRSSRRGRAARS